MFVAGFAWMDGLGFRFGLCFVNTVASLSRYLSSLLFVVCWNVKTRFISFLDLTLIINMLLNVFMDKNEGLKTFLVMFRVVIYKRKEHLFDSVVVRVGSNLYRIIICCFDVIVIVWFLDWITNLLVYSFGLVVWFGSQ